MTARWERELLRLREAPVPLEVMRERSHQPPRHEVSIRPAWERVIAGVVGLAVFVGVGAFAWRAFSTFGDAPPAAGDGPPPLPASPVELWLTADRVPPGPVELVAVLVDHVGVDSTFGVDARVERWDGNEWVSHGELVMCMDHWHCTARIESPGTIDAVPGIGLGPRRGVPSPVERFTTDGLEVGWYRISQVANEGTIAQAIVEIAAGAPAPGPLLPVDAPAISVSPALMSGGGGEVSLYPLIPASSGSQSREDVLRAIEGLSESARLERWDGTGWRRVDRVELSRIEGDSLLRSARLPSLTQGAYRLVREGPDVAHVGHFWVDQTGSRD
jgi:hypothetical protein